MKVPGRGWDLLMRLFVLVTRCVALLLFFCSGAFAPALPRDKTVWSYQGGLFVITNGSLPNGPCFRLAGRVTSGDFFDHLKRIDKETGTIFRSASENLENFSGHPSPTFLVTYSFITTFPPLRQYPHPP